MIPCAGTEGFVCCRGLPLRTTPCQLFDGSSSPSMSEGLALNLRGGSARRCTSQHTTQIHKNTVMYNSDVYQKLHVIFRATSRNESCCYTFLRSCGSSWGVTCARRRKENTPDSDEQSVSMAEDDDSVVHEHQHNNQHSCNLKGNAHTQKHECTRAQQRAQQRAAIPIAHSPIPVHEHANIRAYTHT